MSFHDRAILGDIEHKSADDDATDVVARGLEDFRNAIDDRLKAVETKSGEATALIGRLDKLEAKLNRPAILTGDVETKSVERKALNSYLRTGDATELKTLGLTGANPTGGVFVPPDVRTEIIEKIAEHSPARRFASVVNMTGGLLQFPRLVNEVEPGMVAGETGTKPESEPSFEQIDVKAFEMAVIVPVTQIMLEDANFNMDAWLSAHIYRRFGEKEARQFVVGNGTTEAEGFLTSSELRTFTTSATTLKGDDLIDTFYDIKSAYAARGVWLMNRQTMATVRKLKDSNGAYVWQPGLSAGQPASIMGAPVVEAVDMPNIAPGATPIAFGDFSSGYLIADRVEIQPHRDDVTGYANGIVKLGARRRVGGRVVLGEAITKLKIKAS
ncbi:phage major capsid protein [Methylopila sp. 73B]|uniref:phage major capsid protein n=1 Tax=Methylopila sp. 73B TaxID=1120792 RepID=UPI00037D0DA6|nr:phage major capsid protein [Methylopila sp. 73B]